MSSDQNRLNLGYITPQVIANAASTSAPFTVTCATVAGFLTILTDLVVGNTAGSSGNYFVVTYNHAGQAHVLSNSTGAGAGYDTWAAKLWIPIRSGGVNNTLTLTASATSSWTLLATGIMIPDMNLVSV